MTQKTKMLVYIIPFAGGSKYSFAPVLNSFPESCEVKILELPGRGERFNENLLVDTNAMVNDLYTQLEFNPNKPYAIWGHSMGGLLSYLLAHKIVENNHHKPSLILITGCTAPSVKENQGRHLLDKDRFKNFLRNLGGISDEVLDNPELMEVFEPVIRSDVQALETYQYKPTKALDIPLTVVKGSDESQGVTNFLAWEKETAAKFEFHELKGNHFFIFEHKQKIVELINDSINISKPDAIKTPILFYSV